MLFCERMMENEAIIISGHERVMETTGYARTFKFSKEYNEKQPLAYATVAIDAICFFKSVDIFT